MKAIIHTQYGPPDVLQLAEVAKPAPKDNEVRVRIYAASVNYGDLTARNFKNMSPASFNMPLLLWLPARIAFGLNTPNNPILGSEFAGEIDAVGKAVKGNSRRATRFLAIAVRAWAPMPSMCACRKMARWPLNRPT